MEIISTNLRKANKQHICNYCGCKINNKEEYYNSTIKYDYIYTWKNHVICDKFITKYSNWFDFEVSTDDFNYAVYDEILSRTNTEDDYDQIISDHNTLDLVEFLYHLKDNNTFITSGDITLFKNLKLFNQKEGEIDI